MKKLSEETKIKLIYSGEILLFAIAFAVLGILQLTEVLVISDTVVNIFKYATLVGSCLMIFLFIRAIQNPEKRKDKAIMADKISTLILSPYLISVDILLLAGQEVVVANARKFIAPVFVALSVIYLFQAIYHWFYPLKDLFEDDEEEVEKDNKEDTEEK